MHEHENRFPVGFFFPFKRQIAEFQQQKNETQAKF